VIGPVRNLINSRLARYDIAFVSGGITLFVCLFLNQAFGGKLSLTPFMIPVVLGAWR
jgi:hypothetical protein